MTKREEKDNHGLAFANFMTEFVNESDRAAVILGAAIIETLLGNIIEKYLLPCTSSTDDLLEGDAPLSTFSSRIKMCHRLGLIDDLLAKLLHAFRKLRNGFAHEIANSSLKEGSARDRVCSIAEHFSNVQAFKSACHIVAEQTGRETIDPGVKFRAVLAIFYSELTSCYKNLSPIKTKLSNSFLDNWKDSEKAESTSD